MVRAPEDTEVSPMREPGTLQVITYKPQRDALQVCNVEAVLRLHFFNPALYQSRRRLSRVIVLHSPFYRLI